MTTSSQRIRSSWKRRRVVRLLQGETAKVSTTRRLRPVRTGDEYQHDEDN
jgi:hypothetical protein